MESGDLSWSPFLFFLKRKMSPPPGREPFSEKQPRRLDGSSILQMVPSRIQILTVSPFISSSSQVELIRMSVPTVTLRRPIDPIPLLIS